MVRLKPCEVSFASTVFNEACSLIAATGHGAGVPVEGIGGHPRWNPGHGSMAWAYGACLAVVAASVELKTLKMVETVGPPNPADTARWRARARARKSRSPHEPTTKKCSLDVSKIVARRAFS